MTEGQERGSDRQMAESQLSELQNARAPRRGEGTVAKPRVPPKGKAGGQDRRGPGRGRPPDIRAAGQPGLGALPARALSRRSCFPSARVRSSPFLSRGPTAGRRLASLTMEKKDRILPPAFHSLSRIFIWCRENVVVEVFLRDTRNGCRVSEEVSCALLHTGFPEFTF